MQSKVTSVAEWLEQEIELLLSNYICSLQCLLATLLQRSLFVPSGPHFLPFNCRCLWDAQDKTFSMKEIVTDTICTDKPSHTNTIITIFFSIFKKIFLPFS